VKRTVFSVEEGQEICAMIMRYAGKGKAFEVTLSSDIDQRSAKQNSYLWGVVYKSFLEYFKQSPRKFLEYVLQVGFNAEFIHEFIKKKYKVSSTTLENTHSFCQLVDNIRHDALHDLEFDIPLPNEKELMASYEQYLKERQ
jgi:hypothetical protein